MIVQEFLKKVDIDKQVELVSSNLTVPSPLIVISSSASKSNVPAVSTEYVCILE